MYVRFLTAETTQSMMKAFEANPVENGTFIFCNETDRFYVVMHGSLIGITPKRRDVIQLKCASCGAPLTVDGRSSIVKCSHCGSVFDIDNWDTSI